MYDNYEESIQGADYEHDATIRCSAADPLVKAWLTLKVLRGDADPGALQKAVTTTPSAGVGNIVNDGSLTSGVALVHFFLTAADTTGLKTIDYQFDVKAKTASGAFVYGAAGIWHFWQNITTSTA